MRRIFIATLLLSLSASASQKMSISVLGAPASGKGYYFEKLKNSGWDDILNSRTLTVDILRDQFLSAPFIVKLYEIFKTADFVNSLARENSAEFNSWVTDYYKVMSNIVKEINDRFGHVGIRVVPTGRQFIFYHDRSEITLYRLLTIIDSPEQKSQLEALEKDMLGTNQVMYDNLKRVVRNLQYEGMKSATLAEQNIVFDETGEEPSKLKHRLNLLEKSGYINVVVMIHPKTILINFMQNAFRMIVGTDGGRDSSLSIVGAYNGINRLCGELCGENGTNAYSELARSTKVIETTPNTNMDKVFTDLVTDFKTSAASGSFESETTPIDLLVWITPSDINATINRMNKALATDFERNVWLSLVKLHLENPNKTRRDERRKISIVATGFLRTLTQLSPSQAYKNLLEANQRKTVDKAEQFAGITSETLDEARKVWKLK